MREGTEIMTAEDGVEISEADRVANLRTAPRRAFRYRAALHEGKEEDMIEALDSYEPKTLATMKDGGNSSLLHKACFWAD